MSSTDESTKPLDEATEARRPRNALEDSEVQRLRNLTMNERQAEGEEAKAKAREILQKTRTDCPTAPEGYKHVFQQGGKDLYPEFQKYQAVINLTKDMNSISKDNQLLEATVDQHIPGLPEDFDPRTQSGGPVLDGFWQIFEEYGNIPKFTEDTTVEQFFNQKIMTMDMSFKTIMNIIGSSNTGADSSVTGAVSVDRPRVQIPIQEAIALRGMLMGDVPMIECPAATDTYKYLVETEGTGTGESDQSNVAGIKEGGLYPDQNVKAADKSVQIKKVGVMMTLTEENTRDVPQVVRFANSVGIRRMIENAENQYLNGDGTNDTMTGILNSAHGITSIARPATNTPSLFESYVDFYDRYSAPRNVTNPGAGKEPGMIIMRPAEKARLMRQIDGDERPLWADVVDGAKSKVWGIPIRMSDFVPATSAIFICMEDVGFVTAKAMEIVPGEKSGDYERDRYSLKFRVRGNAIVYYPRSVQLCTNLDRAKSTD